MDETGIVKLRRKTMEEDEWSRKMRDEWQEVRNVSEGILKIHRVPLGSKAEGITQLLYENANNTQCKWTNNWKIEKHKSYTTS